MNDDLLFSSRPKAYSYTRFSTPEQMKGDSLRRQTELATQYARLHNLDLDDSLSLRDLGVSAFRGNNVQTGALGQFLRAINEGLVTEGSYLLVENLDRVSRANPWEAMPIFQMIINSGINIVTLMDNKIYSRAEMIANPMRILESIFTMIRANEESSAKSSRLSAVWNAKRGSASEKPLTRIAPAWLQFNEKANSFDLIEERAAVVRRIFRDALNGIGQHKIAETLNKEGVKPFGRSQGWHRSYIKKILENPSVTGVFVPHKIVYEGNKRIRQPQEPIKGYFPAVIEKEDFEQLQAASRNRRAPKGSYKANVSHLLAGLAKCPICGATMTRVNKGSRKKAGKPYLVCSNAKRGLGCQYKSVKQESIENAILENASWIIQSAPTPDESVEDELSQAEATYQGIEDMMDNIIEHIASAGSSPRLTVELKRLEEELRNCQTRIDDLEAKAVAASGPILLNRFDRLEAALEEQPLDYAKANFILAELLNKVIIDWQDGTLVFDWAHGGQSDITYAWAKA